VLLLLLVVVVVVSRSSCCLLSRMSNPFDEAMGLLKRPASSASSASAAAVAPEATAVKKTKKQDGKTGVTAAAASIAVPASPTLKASEVEEGGKGKKGKGRGRGKVNKDNIEELVTCMAELSLVQARELAALKSILVSVLLFQSKPAEWLFLLYKRVTKQYNDTLVTLSPAQKATFGSVHLFIWLELLGAEQMCKLPAVVAFKEKLEAEVKQEVTSLKTLHEEACKVAGAVKTAFEPPEASLLLRNIVSRQVKIFRLSTCWTESQGRLEYYCTEEAAPVAQALAAVLVHSCHGTLKHNQQPKGRLERKIANLAFGR
jgi:hypothetical protein